MLEQPLRTAGLGGAMAAWRTAIGAAHVRDEAELLETAAATTFATDNPPLAIISPADTAGVSACVKVAARFGVPLYPISRGKNWGLGGRVPSGGPAALLDLSRMDGILDYDATLGTLTLEPGVTFRQVYEFLTRQSSPFWLAPIGGSDYSSVMGNALERGEGIGPLGERSNHVAGLEVVTADGEIIRTGFSRFDGARTAALSRNGVGPSLDGLFAQSNLGVVTRMSVWLGKQPVHQTRFRCRFASPAALAKGLDALRELHHQRVLTDCGFTVWNLYKYLALQGRYPWARTGGATPFRLVARGEPEPSFCGGHLHAGSEAIGAASREALELALAPHCDDLKFEVIDAAMRVADPSLDCAFPNPVNLRTAYWRMRDVAAGPDPERDRCGIVWLCPAFPFDGAVVAAAMQKLAEIGFAHKLEAHVGLSAMSPRLTHAYVSLMYDRTVAGEDERAMACHDAMLEWLMEQGLPPYRLGIHSMRVLGTRDGPFERLLRGLRSHLDPQGILAPGRYVD
ncbi:FAD-binding oxidoreductase [Caenimonas terrae]|uniref:FAD-binding oxidoreductase n=1 Tax=Caenimonas terrae TaxID=696074 RepID=A0ABW0N8G6_9BURK